MSENNFVISSCEYSTLIEPVASQSNLSDLKEELKAEIIENRNYLNYVGDRTENLKEAINKTHELLHYEIENEDVMWRAETEILKNNIAENDLLDISRDNTIKKLKKKLLINYILTGVSLAISIFCAVMYILIGIGII